MLLLHRKREREREEREREREREKKKERERETERERDRERNRHTSMQLHYVRVKNFPLSNTWTHILITLSKPVGISNITTNNMPQGSHRIRKKTRIPTASVSVTYYNTLPYKP